MPTQSLNGTWGLTWAEGINLMTPDYYTGPKLLGRKLLPAAVPAPIHQVLTDAGIIEDINVGLNSLRARWVEEQFWIYRHTFTASAEAASQHAWLVFEHLEFEAIVRLNDVEIGRHVNANRPARFDVTGKLKAGENLIVVQISTGMHSNADKPTADYWCGHIGRLTKRHWLRKPQYQSGWDWSPRLMNVGILGDVTLQWSDAPRMDQVTVFAMPSADLSSATITVRVTAEGIADGEVPATLRARIVETGQEVSIAAKIKKGEQRLELSATIDKPRLWWPIGHGEQFRYSIEVALDAAGQTQSATRRLGIRRVEMDQSPHPVEGRYCILKINNRPIFCKGGNWVPADQLYSTVNEARCRELVDLAVQANFNMLRIWGGGTFASDALCEACDEVGLLMWHDLLFACAQFPGQDPEFKAEVRAETAHAMRTLAHHACVVVWCGSNEIEQGDVEWGYHSSHTANPHYYMFHRELPNLANRESPAVLYWISSPFSPDVNKLPNDPTMGDQHPWAVTLGQLASDWWDYRKRIDRFPNEGGVIGASTPATLRQFLPENERSLLSLSWDHHDNPCACQEYGSNWPGRAYQTVTFWTGIDPLTMSMDDYSFVSGLLHADGLVEYITNYRRRMFDSASAIFWMYNDSWPVTHGWTIVDYYRRKKLAYHPVRRAFAPVTVVAAEDGGTVSIYGVNDTPHDWSGEVRFGIFALAGGLPVDKAQPATLPANSSTVLASFPAAQWHKLGGASHGVFAVLLAGGSAIAQHRLFCERFKDLRFAQARIKLQLAGETLTLTSDAFAWGVCLDVDGERPLADNCVDLLPGIPYTMPWPAELGEPAVLRTGNRDAHKPG